MPITEMHFSFYEKGKDCGWLKNAVPEIKESLESLADDKSRSIFTQVFCNKIYLSKTRRPYESFAEGGEYFQNGCWSVDDREYMVDGGAYIGDTVEDFIKAANGSFSKIYSFEYEYENFRKLSERMKHLPVQQQEKIELYQCGIWNQHENGWCEHFGDSDGTQIISEENVHEGSIPCVLERLDQVLKDKKVTILKLDIEGAEMKGLQGAEEIIRQQKPKLAVCLYHRPEDLWEIPLYLKQLRPDYRMIVKHHSFCNYTDTVLYAV